MINPQGSFKLCEAFVVEFVVGFSFRKGILLLAIDDLQGSFFLCSYCYKVFIIGRIVLKYFCCLPFNDLQSFN
jgi:hypothetical protein